MSGITIAQILIDDSSDKTITGVWVFDRDGYGSLAIPALSYFPNPAEPGEILWRIDENKIYRRNDTNTAWTSVVADIYVPGSTAGSIIYYDGYEFVSLPPTTDGYVLTLNNSIPSWQLGGISISGQTHGSIIYYDGNEWVQLSPSTDGYVLTTHGDGYNPSWEQCVIELSNSNPENVTKFTASPGISPFAARADHKHDISTASPIIIQIGNVTNEGISTALARADHSHAVYSDVPVSIGASNIEGTDGYFARSDHQHAVTDLSITGQQEGSLLYYDGYNWAQLSPGTDGYYLKTNGTGDPPEWAAVSTSSVKRTVTVEFCLTEEVNNTEKYFYTWKTTAAATDSERSGSGGGIQNANTCSPYQVPFNGTIIKALLTIKGVGVQNGTVTYPVTYQTDLFDIGFTSETKVGDIDFSISNAYNVGTYSVGNTNFKGSTTLNVSVTECQLLGLKFINGNSASLAGQTKNAFVTLIIEET